MVNLVQNYCLKSDKFLGVEVFVTDFCSNYTTERYSRKESGRAEGGGEGKEKGEDAGRKTAGVRIGKSHPGCFVDLNCNRGILIAELSRQELAVEACDMSDRDAFGALHLACLGVGTIAEAEFVHLRHHGFSTTGTLYPALRQLSQR